MVFKGSQIVQTLLTEKFSRKTFHGYTELCKTNLSLGVKIEEKIYVQKSKHFWRKNSKNRLRNKKTKFLRGTASQTLFKSRSPFELKNLKENSSPPNLRLTKRPSSSDSKYLPRENAPSFSKFSPRFIPEVYSKKRFEIVSEVPEASETEEKRRQGPEIPSIYSQTLTMKTPDPDFAKDKLCFVRFSVIEL